MFITWANISQGEMREIDAKENRVDSMQINNQGSAGLFLRAEGLSE